MTEALDLEATCKVKHNVHGSFHYLRENGLAELETRENPRYALSIRFGQNEFIQNLWEGNKFTLDKWVHYLYLYERYFLNLREKARLEGRKVRFLEIGIFKGGSIEMWTKFFGAENLEYYAVDIDPKTKELESRFPHAKIFIGDQACPDFWADFCREVSGYFDGILDDGGHTMIQQINTFKCMFSKVRPDGGIYMCEDTHTSYWRHWGGSYRNPSTFIEYSKGLVDTMHEHHINCSDSAHAFRVKHDPLSKQIYGIYFHDSIVVVERRAHPHDFAVMSCVFEGTPKQ